MFINFSKKFLKTISITSLCLAAFVFVFLPDITNAGLGDAIGAGIERILWTFVNVFFGWMVYIGGMVLNYGINEYVIGFGQTYTNSGLGVAIDKLWVVVRDIFNLTFIFGLVMIGLKMIFNSDDAGNKRMLVTLIMAALLVNFSLFITKFVIDFSNIAAYQLVDAFPKKAGLADVSGSFLQLMGLSGIFNFGTDVGVSFSNTAQYSGLGYIFGTLLLFLVSAFVFLGGGLLLMIRFAVLNIYMVLSPLMFIGWVFPAAGNVTSDYWKGFLGRAFFAPAYILMLYLSHKILSSFATTSSGKSLTTMFTPGATDTFASVIPPFILTAIFLMASIVIAQKMSSNGGSAVISAQNAMMNKVRGTVRGAAVKSLNAGTYVVRKPARAGINRTGAYLKTKFNDSQAKAQSEAANPKSTKTQKVKSWLYNNASVDRAARGATKKMEDTQFGTGTTYASESAYESKVRADATGRANVMEMAELNALSKKKTSNVALTPEEEARLETLEKKRNAMIASVTDLSVKQMEDMTDSMLESIAENLTNSQVENFMKSDNVSAETKGKLINARRASIKDKVEKVVNGNKEIITSELTKLTIDQIETLGDDWVRKNVHLFSKSQMDDLKKSKKFTETQRNSYADSRKKWHEESLDGKSPTGEERDINKLFKANDGNARKPEDIANLGRKVLTSEKALPFLSASVLEVIVDKRTLELADRLDIYNKVMSADYKGNNKEDLRAYFDSPQGQRNWGHATKDKTKTT